MMPLMMPLASTAGSAGVYGIVDQKGHVAPNFDHLGLRNATVPLMMPSASCDADTSANGIT